MDIDIRIQLPKIWPGEFVKTSWSSVIFIVGPNGTGKSLLAEQIQKQLIRRKYRARLLSAERLAGFEKTSYSLFSNSELHKGLNISHFNDYKTFGNEYGLSTPAFVLLKQRLDIRIKIEAILSDLFKKNIRLVEEGGFLKPKMQNNYGGEEYSLREQECHGLKEIISLLSFLYDDEYNCLIFDEPELHLHPQFQAFFLNEIRKIAGDPNLDTSKKLFFIITHSPYFLDIQSLGDLTSILVCHYKQMPTYIKDEDLDSQDKYVLERFIPRFNTHHKQFFFSPNPVFVEGYTDQQIISLLLEKSKTNISASGTSIIDVGGKSELAVFYRLCKKLSIDCRIIADYDALFRGRLRACFCSSEVVKTKFVDKGLGTDPSRCIGELESSLLTISDEMMALTGKSIDVEINSLLAHLKSLYLDKGKNLDNIRDATYLSILRFSDKIKDMIPSRSLDIELVKKKAYSFTDSIKADNIFILEKGELEHYYKASVIDYLKITNNKDKLFQTERDYILGLSMMDIIDQYTVLFSILKEAIPLVNVDLVKHLRVTIIEFIQRVQLAVDSGDVNNIETLRTNGRVDFPLFSQILDCHDGDFAINVNKNFTCKVYLKDSLLGEVKSFEFTNKTTASDFQLI